MYRTGVCRFLSGRCTAELLLWYVGKLKCRAMIRMNYKNRFYVIAVALCLAACDNSYESIFKQSPDDRLRETLTEYSTLLMDAPHGWKASLYTGSGAGYFYYFDFNDNGNVTMLSDFGET